MTDIAKTKVGKLRSHMLQRIGWEIVRYLKY